MGIKRTREAHVPTMYRSLPTSRECLKEASEHVGTSGALRNDSDTSGTCTRVGMKSQSTGELEDQGNVADMSTVCTNGQSIADDTKTAKNTSKMIRMRQMRPRMQNSPLTHEIKTPSIPGDGATSAMKGTTHTHRKTHWSNPYTHKIERSTLGNVSRCWARMRGLRQVLRTKRLAIRTRMN